jgi:hypothetical protein
MGTPVKSDLRDCIFTIELQFPQNMAIDVAMMGKAGVSIYISEALVFSIR